LELNGQRAGKAAFGESRHCESEVEDVTASFEG